MNKDVKVTIFSQIYDTPPAMLRRCIESVLYQSYQNIEFIIVDNGSTDGSKEILEEYRDHDSRIRLIRYENNERGYRAIKLAAEIASGEYIANIDSDDWFELNFFEKLLSFMCNNRLDIAAAGSCFVDEDGKLLGKRHLSDELILQSSQFAEGYPYYHAFYRTIWAKLIRTCIFKRINYSNIGIKYGGDTCCSFRWLRASSRMGIINKTLHNYTVRKKSSSSLYDPTRFDSDVFLYNDAMDFLHGYGPISSVNRRFITSVYANAVKDTVNVLNRSLLSPMEKLHEYRRIATHPLTVSAYHWRDEVEMSSRRALLIGACNAALQLKKDENDEDFRAVAQTICTQCGIAATRETLPLLLNKVLQDDFLKDNQNALAEKLLKMTANSTNDLPGKVLQKLAVNNRMLFWIKDSLFFHCYHSIYWIIWQGRYEEALDKMAALELKGKVNNAQETFYQLFINLAAQLGEENAFIYGKIRLAWWYLSQGCNKQCAIIIEELEEMGLSKDKEVLDLHQKLNVNVKSRDE